MFFFVVSRENQLHELLSTFIFAPLGIFGAVGFSFIAFWKELRRYYVYAALIILTVFGGPYLNVEPPVYLLLGGITILIPDIVVLVRFMQKYPTPDKEA